ncbi:MAG: phosphotransferase [Gammaproteobacteria bacterium]|nr:phosphotransferase [Gammaproteobacteria bacterium]
MGSRQRPVVSLEDLSTWCEGRFKSALRNVMFEVGYSSAVFGITLNDDRQLVAKVRQWRERLASCWQVHRSMWEAGFPCPEPLGPPERHGSLAVSFEGYLSGGEPLPRGTGAARELGRVLAELVKLAPGAGGFPELDAPWGFLRWDDEGDTWPPATDITENLNSKHEPQWIDHAAKVARSIIRANELPPVLGHGDWWSENIRWENGRLHAVDDWDSVVSLPEPAIAGVAAALFADGQSTIEESAAFLDAYVSTSDRRWNTTEYQMSWAAGLWARLFDARKESVQGGLKFAALLKGEVEERLDRAGVRFTLHGHETP